MTFITATAPWNPEDRWHPDDDRRQRASSGAGVPWTPVPGGLFDIVALITDTAESGDVTHSIPSRPLATATTWIRCPATTASELPLTILAPSFQVAKEADTNQVAGTVVTYTLTVTNDGNVEGTAVVLSDTVPLGLTYLDGDGSYDDTDVTWDLASIAGGGGTDGGWFSAYLPCEADQSIVNDAYGVVSSQERKTASGAPVSFDTILPTIDLTLDSTPGRIEVDDTVYLTATASTDGTELGYEWDFGAGPASGGLTASYSWPVTGTYTVWFTATDGCAFTEALSTTVQVSPPATYIYLPLVLRNY